MQERFYTNCLWACFGTRFSPPQAEIENSKSPKSHYTPNRITHPIRITPTLWAGCAKQLRGGYFHPPFCSSTFTYDLEGTGVAQDLITMASGGAHAAAVSQGIGVMVAGVANAPPRVRGFRTDIGEAAIATLLSYGVAVQTEHKR